MAPSDPIFIGTRYGYAQSVGELCFTVADRRQGVRILGAPGTGKTTLMARMIEQDIAAGRGFAVIDGQGRLAQLVLDLIPESHTRRAAFFSPADVEHPIGLNIFHRSDDADTANLAVSHTIGVFKRLWPEAFFARSEDILGNTVQALCEVPGATFLSIPRMLNDDHYRKTVVAKITDPVIRDFWSVEYANRGDRFNIDADAPVLNKVRRFLASSLLRNIVGQRKSAIDFAMVMNQDRMFVADLCQARAGEGEMTLIGTLLLASFTMPTLRRLALPAAQRSGLQDFTIYVDGFQHFANDALTRILSVCSEANISLVVAYQYSGQLPESVQSALETMGTTIVFRAGGDDAERLSLLLEKDFIPGELVALPNGTFCARVLQEGQSSFPLKGFLPVHELSSKGRSGAIVRASRERFGHPRANVERWVSEFFQVAEPQDDARELKREMQRVKREARELKAENKRKDDLIDALKDIAVVRRAAAFVGGEPQLPRVKSARQHDLPP